MPATSELVGRNLQTHDARVANFTRWTANVGIDRSPTLSSAFVSLLGLNDASHLLIDTFQRRKKSLPAQRRLYRQLSEKREQAIEIGRSATSQLDSTADQNLAIMLTFNILMDIESQPRILAVSDQQIADTDFNTQQRVVNVWHQMHQQNPAETDSGLLMLAADTAVFSNNEDQDPRSTYELLTRHDFEPSILASHMMTNSPEAHDMWLSTLLYLTLAQSFNSLGLPTMPAERIATEVQFLTQQLGRAFTEFPEGGQAMTHYNNNFGQICDYVTRHFASQQRASGGI